MSDTTTPATPPLLLDAYAAELVTGVHPATIRWWAHKGLLTRHGTDAKGRTLYDLAEIEARADARRV